MTAPLYAIVAPMLSGKTTAAICYGSLADVDNARGAFPVRAALLPPLLKALDWPAHNKVWFSMVRDWAQSVHLGNPNHVLLCHDHHAAEAARAVVGAIVLIPEAEFLARSRDRAALTDRPEVAALARLNREQTVEFIAANPQLPVFGDIVGAFFHIIDLQLLDGWRRRPGDAPGRATLSACGACRGEGGAHHTYCR
jgi:hypothetical protein